jgi:hypothetical protein
VRILIGCEFSGIVRDAFAARGHDAWSCDLLPTERPGNHLQCDVLDVLTEGWDMAIFHPPCTYLAVSGLHWNGRVQGRAEKTEDALMFVRRLLDAPIQRIALENPVSCISSRIRKPDQIIQPWLFGHDASKKTCLWLKELAPLIHTRIVPPKGWKLVKFAADMLDDGEDEAWCQECDMDFADCDCIGPTQDDIEYQVINGFMFGRNEVMTGKPVWSNQTPSGQNKLGPSPTRAKDRAKTYEGIATAMADQWS